jgi:hypothetical protein
LEQARHKIVFFLLLLAFEEILMMNYERFKLKDFCWEGRGGEKQKKKFMKNTPCAAMNYEFDGLI